MTGYGIEACWEDFRLGLLTSAVMNLIAGATIEPALMGGSGDSIDISVTEVLFDRMAAAIEAHGVLDMVSD